jgi:hypothetical protein
LEHLWPFVGGALGAPLMTILVSVILYMRSPESAWAYALLKYSLIFLAGTLFPVFVLVAISLANIYRRKRRERDRVHKYTSQEKAWVDFDAELKPAVNRYASLLSDISKETMQIGPRSQELIEAILIPDPQRRRAKTSKGAKALNKNCMRMEIATERLAKARDDFFEVTEGLLKSVPVASEGNLPQLTVLRDSLVDMQDSASSVIQSQKELIEHSKAIHGQVSRDVNTSMNWLVAVCEENVRVVDGFKRRMEQRLFPLLDHKLNN